MELVNKTRLVGGYTTSTDKTGREWLVVVAKGTYGIPDHPGHAPRLLDQQAPLIMADVFPGEPSESAALYENDFALHKPRCDVLLHGHCHAPNGEPATEVNVALKVGTLVKAFKVIGARIYEDSALSHSISKPVPFTTMPITYAQAFGGVDRTHADPAKHKWYPWNPVGAGFYPTANSAQTNGLPLPNTEELERPVTAPTNITSQWHLARLVEHGGSVSNGPAPMIRRGLIINFHSFPKILTCAISNVHPRTSKSIIPGGRRSRAA